MASNPFAMLGDEGDDSVPVIKAQPAKAAPVAAKEGACGSWVTKRGGSG